MNVKFFFLNILKTTCNSVRERVKNALSRTLLHLVLKKNKKKTSHSSKTVTTATTVTTVTTVITVTTVTTVTTVA